MDTADKKLDDLRNTCTEISVKLDNAVTSKQLAYWGIGTLLAAVGSFIVHLLIKG